MIGYNWKILKTFVKDELITGVHYRLTGDNGKNKIETEGNYFFIDPELKTRFLDVTEAMVIDWLEQETTIDGQSHIKYNIEKQFSALEHEEVTAPWLPQTFKMKL